MPSYLLHPHAHSEMNEKESHAANTLVFTLSLSHFIAHVACLELSMMAEELLGDFLNREELFERVAMSIAPIVKIQNFSASHISLYRVLSTYFEMSRSGSGHIK